MRKLLIFTASWCDPCRRMAPIMEDLFSSGDLDPWYSGREIIDVDTDWKTPQRWGVNGVPTYIILDDRGQEIARHTGAWSGLYIRQHMRDWLIDAGPTLAQLLESIPDLCPITLKEKPNMITAIKKMLGLTQDEPVIGSIELWAGYSSRVPVGYARCEGQRMSIRDNPALFSLIGVTYGGDGREYFCLPDYRPRNAKGEPQAWDPTKSPVMLICTQGMYPMMD